MKYINVIMFLLFYWVSQLSFLHINSSFIYIYIFFVSTHTKKNTIVIYSKFINVYLFFKEIS